MERVTFELKEKIDVYYKKSKSPFAYATFTGINLFACDDDNFLQEIGQNAFIVSQEKGTNKSPIITVPYIINPNDQHMADLKKFVQENNIERIEYISEQEAEYFKKYFAVYENDEWMTEAIYPIERFKAFEHIEGKRHEAEIFFEEHPDFEFVKFEKKYESNILSLLEKRSLESTHPSYYFEDQGIKFIMQNYDILEAVLWFLLFVKNEIVWFTFGEIGNHETFLSYFIKWDREYKGSYQALEYLTANHELLKDIKYFNNTSLTKIEWIKDMKLQLKPEKLLKSYVAILAKE